jgi:hypothetical protein
MFSVREVSIDVTDVPQRACRSVWAFPIDHAKWTDPGHFSSVAFNSFVGRAKDSPKRKLKKLTRQSPVCKVGKSPIEEA